MAGDEHEAPEDNAHNSEGKQVRLWTRPHLKWAHFLSRGFALLLLQSATRFQTFNIMLREPSRLDSLPRSYSCDWKKDERERDGERNKRTNEPREAHSGERSW